MKYCAFFSSLSLPSDCSMQITAAENNLQSDNLLTSSAPRGCLREMYFRPE